MFGCYGDGTMNSSSDGVTVAANGTNAWKATRTVIGGDTEDEVSLPIHTLKLILFNGNTGSNGSNRSHCQYNHKWISCNH